MKSVIFAFVLMPVAIVFATENAAQLLQTNVNIKNTNIDSSASVNTDNKPYQSDIESATSSINIQQDALSSVNQQDGQQQSSNTQQQQQSNNVSPQSNAQIPLSPQNIQLLKEANSQYQYQINSKYEEKTRPVYLNEPLPAANSQHQTPLNSQYVNQPVEILNEVQNNNNNNIKSNNNYPYYPYSQIINYPPYYRENSNLQEIGNGQRRTESNVLINDNMKSQYDNQDQSAYTHQRSQSYIEYGKGESSPDYNTYAYKRTYY